nr:ATP-dependent helicase [Candidatus Saccharibacteria bacterium]
MKSPSFADVYRQLNAAQREAVDTVYGPVLVIAGPGTGKTQLLSARVAKILEATDALPQNILCLTFTESGARNMRERLGRFIGSAAYDVQINTYHAFGSTIINRYPEYFTDLRLERPVDELGKRQILEEIVQNLDYRNPLKQIRHHLGDLIGTISEIKRGLLSPEDLRIIAQTNLDGIQDVQNALAKILQPYTARMPSKLTTAVSVYTEIIQALTDKPSLNRATSQPIVALTNLAATELQLALTAAQESDSTRPLTRWKNSWLVKNVKGQYTLGGSLESKRVTSLADVLETYHNALQERGLYDFDDMILRAIDVLERNDDLRYTLQEQYQYILLDEFQDTNAAQLQLVRLLTDNPVNEGRPNILAVGDDDQAIYAFQGAEASNMLDYYRLYRDVKVISLQENYRSRAEILETSRNIASQINNRLEKQFNSVSKELTAENTNLPPATLA